MTNTTNTVAASGAAILFEHEDGRYAVNPNTTGDPAWHRLGPVDVSALAAPAQAVAILFEHEDGRYAINPDTTGDPAWHRLGPVDVSAIAAEPAQPVAHVSQETFNDDGTSDIIIPALPIGMALYAAPQPAVQAAPVDATVQEDAERWQFLAEYLVGPRTDLDDEIVGCDSVQKMARVLDATIAAQKETND